MARNAVPPFDLFIIDVRMPELSGYEVVRALRREPNGGVSPILMLTSLESAEDVIEGLDAGDYLTKRAITDSELLARVRALLALRDRHQEHVSASRVARGVASDLRVQIVVGDIEPVFTEDPRRRRHPSEPRKNRHVGGVGGRRVCAAGRGRAVELLAHAQAIAVPARAVATPVSSRAPTAPASPVAWYAMATPTAAMGATRRVAAVGSAVT